MSAIAKCRKIHLPLLDTKGNVASPGITSDVIEEYRIADSGEPLSEEFMARVKARGNLIDCGRTLRAMVVRARDPVRGMDFEEMREIGRLVDKIEAVPLGGYLYLDESEYGIVCARTVAPYVAEYNKGLHVFLEALHSAPQIDLEEPKRPSEMSTNTATG